MTPPPWVAWSTFVFAAIAAVASLFNAVLNILELTGGSS